MYGGLYKFNVLINLLHTNQHTHTLAFTQTQHAAKKELITQRKITANHFRSGVCLTALKERAHKVQTEHKHYYEGTHTHTYTLIHTKI